MIFSPQVRKDFFNHLMLFYVGGTREASSVLKSSAAPLMGMRTLVEDFWAVLCGSGDMHELGEVLRMSWHYKKQMGNITNAIIDNYYEEAMYVGALGGKLLGAGQGGFLLFLVAPRDQKAVRVALRNLRQIPFHLENEGSKIIYVGS
jgi:D-glycero-alpha-D-manno-heptose-7-phosphate kinase